MRVMFVVIQWAIALTPAVALRFRILGRPTEKRPAVLISIALGIAYLFIFTYLAWRAGVDANMAPAALRSGRGCRAGSCTRRARVPLSSTLQW